MSIAQADPNIDQPKIELTPIPMEDDQQVELPTHENALDHPSAKPDRSIVVLLRKIQMKVNLVLIKKKKNNSILRFV